MGIGRACATRMGKEGASVAIFDVTEADGRALAADPAAQGHEAGLRIVDGPTRPR